MAPQSLVPGSCPASGPLSFLGEGRGYPVSGPFPGRGRGLRGEGIGRWTGVGKGTQVRS